MGKLRDAARTRKKIMEAAREEFAALGFAGARLESIARRASLSKQLLYHYFASKAVLFEETLQSKYDQHRAAVTEYEGPGAGGVKGVGMLGTAGIQAAVANAVFHAVGKRVRHLPIRIGDLIGD